MSRIFENHKIPQNTAAKFVEYMLFLIYLVTEAETCLFLLVLSLTKYPVQ